MSRLHQIFLLFISLMITGMSSGTSSPYPGINDDEWKQIIPHLITDSHPAKNALDNIFKNNRNSVYDIHALLDIGFYKPGVNGQHVYALFHDKIKGYLIKVYRPAYPSFTPKGNDWQSWLLRIKGAEMTRKEIEAKNYTKLLTVPKKWIYALPPDTSRADPINFILVVEDMNLVTKEQNLKLYKRKIKKKHLKAVYDVVTTLGLSDGCSHNNLFWTKDMKLAFVDTESVHSWPVCYHLMVEYLTHPLRKWWKGYVKSNSK